MHAAPGGAWAMYAISAAFRDSAASLSGPLLLQQLTHARLRRLAKQKRGANQPARPIEPRAAQGTSSNALSSHAHIERVRLRGGEPACHFGLVAADLTGLATR